MRQKRGFMKRLLDVFTGNQFGYSQALFPGENRGAQGFTGGAYNALGQGSDKGNQTIWLASNWNNREILDIVYRESAAARKFVDMVVDDMFIRPRSWLDLDENQEKEINMAYGSLGIDDKLGRAMKAGRLHGSGFLAFVMKDGSHGTPLPDEVYPGDLVNVVVFDRWDISQTDEINNDLTDTNYGYPDYYHFRTQGWGLGGQRAPLTVKFHHSRVLRFDGIPRLNDTFSARSTGYASSYYGTPAINPIMRSIDTDASVSSAIGHLVQEANIPVLRLQAFGDSLRGGGGAGNFAESVGLEETLKKFDEIRSLYKAMVMDKDDEFERVSVQFGSLPELMERYEDRIASDAGVPITRWRGKSPVGLQSTGDSEESNYALHVGAMQETKLRPAHEKIDMVLLPSIGIADCPQFEYPMLMDVSSKDQADIFQLTAAAASSGVQAGIMDENEARECMVKLNPGICELEELSDADLEAMRKALEPPMPPGGPGGPDGPKDPKNPKPKDPAGK